MYYHPVTSCAHGISMAKGILEAIYPVPFFVQECQEAFRTGSSILYSDFPTSRNTLAETSLFLPTS